MTRPAAATGVVLAVATLALSACGSSGPHATTAPRTRPALRPFVSASGTGSKTLGNFTVLGKLSIAALCTGRGWVTVTAYTTVANQGEGTHCPTRDLGPGNWGSSFAPGTPRVRIKVHAPADVHWTVAVRETDSAPATTSKTQ